MRMSFAIFVYLAISGAIVRFVFIFFISYFILDLLPRAIFLIGLCVAWFSIVGVLLHDLCEGKKVVLRKFKKRKIVICRFPLLFMVGLFLLSVGVLGIKFFIIMNNEVCNSQIREFLVISSLVATFWWFLIYFLKPMSKIFTLEQEFLQ